MRGLLSSRVLKGPSGAERLSKSLFRHSKLRKRSKRPSLSRPKSLLHTHPSGNAGREGKEEEQGGGHAGDGVVGASAANVIVATGDNHDYEKCTSITEELLVATTSESDDKDDDDSDFDVIDVDENVIEMEGNADEEEEEEEEKEDGKEDSTRAAFGCDMGSHKVRISGNRYENSTGASDSLGLQESNPHLQEDDVRDAPKGPIILPDWEAVMSIIVEMPTAICFICGGKNTGKSTFARYLVNSLLNRCGKVGFLDTDVGQPEFTPSGCLSLHVLDKPIVGLPALEMKVPERCHFFGDTSPKSNPEEYLRSVFSLYDHFKNKCIMNQIESKVTMRQKGRFPLVINTHGWIQGVGLDVLVKIIDYVVPTHIVQIVSKTSSKNLPLNRFWESCTITPSSSQLLYINNALGDNTHLAEIKYDARELRDLRLLAYFQKSVTEKFMLTSRLSSLFEKAASALACCTPFQVPISAINVLQQHFQVPADEIVYSLNATLVGLGVSDKREQDTKPWCVGLGIVRAVDVSRGLFYVITPLKLEVLQRVNTFLQGRMEIPVPFLKAPRFVSPYLCKNTISVEGTGSAVMGKGKKKVLRMLRSPGIL